MYLATFRGVRYNSLRNYIETDLVFSNKYITLIFLWELIEGNCFVRYENE